jgi:hypothetical protein
MNTNTSTFLTRQQFKNRYGERIYTITNILEKLYKKRTKLEQHTIFLKKCKQLNLIPNGLTLKNTTNLPKSQQILNNTMYKLRNNSLQQKQKQLKFIETEIRTQESILKCYLETTEPNRRHQDDIKWINKYDGKFKEKLIINQSKKIEELKKEQNKSQIQQVTMNNINDLNNVINISKVNLSKAHLKVLSKGLKFVPTQKNISTITTITNCETSLNSSPPIIKKAAISEITTFINKWRKPKKSNMTKEETKLLNEIKSMDQIVIIQADKGGKIVIMDKTEYISKVEEKLDDENTYEKLTKDPTEELKAKINDIATKLNQQKKINTAQKLQLTGIDDLPTIRGQPKLHKANYPMRIVTCSRDTILSPISQFIFKIIKELRTTLQGTISNTFKFVDEISGMPLQTNENLASLDIGDLYTNIPVNKAVNITINELIKSKKLDNIKLTKTDVKNLLLLSLKNSYFQFNNKFYKQKSGLPMGNTLSPIIADIYMNYYTKKHLQEINTPSKIWRYVDDILIITTMNEQQLNKYVNNLNKIKGTIKFTYEFENNNKINFLDTTLTKQTINNELQIKIRWFRKDSAADRLLNYHSSHGKSIKENIVKNMTRRIIQTTRDANEQQEDINKLKNVLINSNYPVKEIETLMKEACQTSNMNHSPKTNNNEFKFSISLPYVPGIEVLKRRLEKLKIKLYFSYPNKLQSYFNQSMKVQSKSVVYQLQCDCNPPKIYNGETKVGIKNRMKQHFQLINKLDNKSEMVQHIEENRYQCLFNTEQAFILQQEKNWNKRRIKEAIYSLVNNSINKHDNLIEAWDPILFKTKQQIQRKIQQQRQQQSNNKNNN